nr:peptidase domain-containing ABC transporter [Rhodoferax sp.]
MSQTTTAQPQPHSHPARTLTQGLTDRLHFTWAAQLPVILQTEAAECGLACLAMVAGYHGHRVDLATLRQRFGMSLKGATLKTVMGVATAMQMTPRALKLDLDHLQQLKLPCILHWDMQHFVVLRSIVRDVVEIHDPGRGLVKLPLTEVSTHFSGVALELTPTDAFEKREETQTLRLRQMMGRVTGLKRSLGQILLLAGALEVFALVAPFFMQWVIDFAIVSADRNLLTVLALGFCLLAVVQTLIGLVRSYVVLYMATHVNLQWVANVFTHLMHLPVSYFEKRHLGDVVSRFRSIDTIQRALTTSFVEALVDGLMAVAMLVVMAYYSLLLCAVVLVAIAVYGLLRWLSYGPLRHATEDQIVLQAKEQSLFLESVRGVQAIKLFGNEADRTGRWLNAVVDAMNQALATQKLNIGVQGSHQILSALENIVVVWLGARLVMDNQFTVGMLTAFISYKTTFAQRVHSLIDKFVELIMLKVQGARLADIVLAQPEPQALGLLPPDDLTLTLKDVWFRYSESDPWVLQGVDLTIKPGESVAIVGGSGCGKTTLLKLLLGLMAPSKGEISLGGVSLATLGPSGYRPLIGAVMQDDMLLAGTLMENIAFFDQQSDMQRVAACAHAAAIHQDILAMPMNYNTLVGDMGSSLSGGQKQRVLLARALYKNPKLLFLDEATSHLDAQREELINEAVKQLHLTRIIVAHRPTTIAAARRVIELVDGCVVRDTLQCVVTQQVSPRNREAQEQDTAAA